MWFARVIVFTSFVSTSLSRSFFVDIWQVGRSRGVHESPDRLQAAFALPTDGPLLEAALLRRHPLAGVHLRVPVRHSTSRSMMKSTDWVQHSRCRFSDYTWGVAGCQVLVCFTILASSKYWLHPQIKSNMRLSMWMSGTTFQWDPCSWPEAFQRLLLGNDIIVLPQPTVQGILVELSRRQSSVCIFFVSSSESGAGTDVVPNVRKRRDSYVIFSRVVMCSWRLMD